MAPGFRAWAAFSQNVRRPWFQILSLSWLFHPFSFQDQRSTLLGYSPLPHSFSSLNANWKPRGEWPETSARASLGSRSSISPGSRTWARSVTSVSRGRTSQTFSDPRQLSLGCTASTPSSSAESFPPRSCRQTSMTILEPRNLFSSRGGAPRIEFQDPIVDSLARLL